MIKTAKLGKYSTVRLVDTFSPTVVLTNGGTTEVDIHFGTVMDVLVITAHKKQLSKDNLERIRQLTEVKQ